MSTGRAAQESYRKRMKNYMKRGNELARKYGINISIIVERNGRVRTYTCWKGGQPLTLEQAKECPQAIHLTPKDFPRQGIHKEWEEVTLVGDDEVVVENATLVAAEGETPQRQGIHKEWEEATAVGDNELVAKRTTLVADEREVAGSRRATPIEDDTAKRPRKLINRSRIIRAPPILRRSHRLPRER